MAVSYSLGILANTSNANMQAWIAKVRAVMIAGGWILDNTSHADLSTAVVPGAVNTVAVTDLWRSDEGADGTQEIYSLFEYGTGASSVNNPAMWITNGWVPSGLGLSGLTSTRSQIYVSSDVSGNQPFRLSVGAGYFILQMGAPSNRMWFTLERVKNTSSPYAFRNILANFWYSTQNTYPRSQVVDLTENYMYHYIALAASAAACPMATESVSEGKIGVGLIFPRGPGLLPPSLNILLHNSGQLGGNDGLVQHKAYGNFITYRVTDIPMANTHMSFRWVA